MWSTGASPSVPKGPAPPLAPGPPGSWGPASQPPHPVATQTLHGGTGVCRLLSSGRWGAKARSSLRPGHTAWRGVAAATVCGGLEATGAVAVLRVTPSGDEQGKALSSKGWSGAAGSAVQSSPGTSASRRGFGGSIFTGQLAGSGRAARDASKEVGQGALASQHHKILTEELGLVLNPVCTPFLKIQSASFWIRRRASMDERRGCEYAWWEVAGKLKKKQKP